MFEQWLHYFKHNNQHRLAINWNTGVTLSSTLRVPLARSLQRFQLGESGDGSHLKKAARALNDEHYSAAIRLFVAEEQEHAALMAGVLRALDMPLLQKHWSDNAFRLLCLISNIYLELLLLVVTEVIAKRYFRLLHDASADAVLRAVCCQILHDEEAHIAFHCAALQTGVCRLPGALHGPLRLLWRTLFEVVTTVVLTDHGSMLRAAGITKPRFRRECRAIFERSTAAVFAAKPLAGQAAILMQRTLP